jgi:Cation/multidrug efflux pump
MLLSGAAVRCLPARFCNAVLYRFRSSYRGLLGTILNHRGVSPWFSRFCAGSWVLVPFLGQDFFPSVDAGTFRLHVRAATGTRVEETANLVDQVEATIRRQIPANELQGIVDNMACPYRA